MQALWETANGAPEWAVGLGVCLAAAALGLVGMLLLARVSGAQPLARLIPAIVALFAAFAVVGYHQLRKEHDPVAMALAAFEHGRLSSVIFKVAPGAEAALRARLQAVAEMAAPEQRAAKMERAIADFVDGYVLKYLVLAPDDDTRAFIQHVAWTLDQLKDQPDLCVPYYLADGSLEVSRLPADLRVEDDAAKATLIERAAAQPTPPPTDIDMTEVVPEIRDAFTGRGYDIKDLNKIGVLGILPHKTGCRIAREFTDTIGSMTPDRAAYLYKALIVAGQQKPEPTEPQ